MRLSDVSSDVCSSDLVRAKHKEQKGHKYDQETARDFYARSLDGGMTWSIEDAFANGQTAERYNNRLKDSAKAPVSLTAPINFNHPDLALTFQRVPNTVGPTHFYYSYARGDRKSVVSGKSV